MSTEAENLEAMRTRKAPYERWDPKAHEPKPRRPGRIAATVTAVAIVAGGLVAAGRNLLSGDSVTREPVAGAVALLPIPERIPGVDIAAQPTEAQFGPLSQATVAYLTERYPQQSLAQARSMTLNTGRTEVEVIFGRDYNMTANPQGIAQIVRGFQMVADQVQGTDLRYGKAAADGGLTPVTAEARPLPRRNVFLFTHGAPWPGEEAIDPEDKRLVQTYVDGDVSLTVMQLDPAIGKFRGFLASTASDMLATAAFQQALTFRSNGQDLPDLTGWVSAFAGKGVQAAQADDALTHFDKSLSGDNLIRATLPRIPANMALPFSETPSAA